MAPCLLGRTACSNTSTIGLVPPLRIHPRLFSSSVAAGCACVIFTTGRGTPTGNAIAPVLKVTANKRTYTHMEDNMDVDLSGIIEGTKTIEESGKMLLDEIVQVCNGKLTKAEAYGFSYIAVDHVCRFV